MVNTKAIPISAGLLLRVSRIKKEVCAKQTSLGKAATGLKFQISNFRLQIADCILIGLARAGGLCLLTFITQDRFPGKFDLVAFLAYAFNEYLLAFL